MRQDFKGHQCNDNSCIPVTVVCLYAPHSFEVGMYPYRVRVPLHLSVVWKILLFDISSLLQFTTLHQGGFGPVLENWATSFGWKSLNKMKELPCMHACVGPSLHPYKLNFYFIFEFLVRRRTIDVSVCLSVCVSVTLLWPLFYSRYYR